VTVVIAARPGQSYIKALPACCLLDYPGERLEILVTRGKQPSAQRNAALKAAQGDLIYFLDDDSVPQSGNLTRAVPWFRAPEVQMLGGPNLCPPEAPWLEQVFALVLGSWLAFGPSRARYRRFGQLRETTEKELILCNQMARRATLLELGGFNEALYPNEENALMDELQKRGGKLMYDPDFFVYRRPRRSLTAFAKMLMTYGRGRAEQFRLHPTPGSALNFVPPVFVLYLALVVGVFVFLPAYAKMAAWPLAAYAGALVVQGFFLAPGGKVRGRLAALPLIALSNILYGWGFWRGLFTRLRPARARPIVPVELEVIKPLAAKQR
jgi:cellulose synthase/poly-beta-1,6-N-acetylglucosamine synthase-like glycosyltransferase